MEKPDSRARSRKNARFTLPAAWAMMAQFHFKIKTLLKYKMGRIGRRVVEFEEEYTPKICSSCGGIKNDLGGSSMYKCSFCHVVHGRDVNAVKNIFHKNTQMLC
ncbi:hypothetical protein BBJ29_006228 [Phytophthora kernoviae]|uniref:Cas12f1-like TNB domain-containing protein n=1 Tax=Phytophthora kernoviae TaxID=325452 RepID=A0A3F2RGK7_9STRA|nr:hypothetical protein BBJ29_006228 [Phytophthora kernoviae]RLN56444.1 hypothetical protein BBP00_00008006 [Phytophthora kernoviae]